MPIFIIFILVYCVALAAHDGQVCLAAAASAGRQNPLKLKLLIEPNFLPSIGGCTGFCFPSAVLESNFPFTTLSVLNCTRCGTIFYSPMIVGDSSYYDYLSRNISWYYSEKRWEYPIVADILAKEQPQLFLEVGCGAGHFLRLARTRGYEGHGCEVNTPAVETLRTEGFSILTDLDDGLFQYDALLMFQVLEHFSDPYSFLKSILSHIRPGGIIIISTPVTPSGAAFNANPFLMPPHHQWLPTTQAFTFLAERLGLVCERVLCDPPDCSQVVYALRKRCHWLPYSQKISRHWWELAGWYAWRLATLMNCDWAKIGHTGMALFRKPDLAC